MTAPPSFLAGLVLGLASSLHCVAMCGGIVGALTLALPAPVRANRLATLSHVVAYSVGRTASYAIAGGLAGGLGAGLVGALDQSAGHMALRWVAALALMAFGCHVAGWLPAFGAIGRAGLPLWDRVEPLVRGIDPARGRGHAALYGAAWGWLPCGMVYGALLYAALSGSAGGGMLTMLGFGLGTVPALTTAGLLTGLLRLPGRRQLARHALGLAAVTLAIGSLIEFRTLGDMLCAVVLP